MTREKEEKTHENRGSLLLRRKLLQRHNSGFGYEFNNYLQNGSCFDNKFLKLQNNGVFTNEDREVVPDSRV